LVRGETYLNKLKGKWEKVRGVGADLKEEANRCLHKIVVQMKTGMYPLRKKSAYFSLLLANE